MKALQNLAQLNFSLEYKKIFTSFYKNNLVCISAKNGSNGSHIGRMMIDLDESKKGISHTLIRNYLINVRKKNHIIVDQQYVLKQSQLQSHAQYLRDELITVEQIFRESNDINGKFISNINFSHINLKIYFKGAILVLDEDGNIKFLRDEDQIKQLIQYIQNYNYNIYQLPYYYNQHQKGKKRKYLQQEKLLMYKAMIFQMNQNLIPYKQVVLNNILLFISGAIAISIVSDIYSEEVWLNLSNPLIKSESEFKFVFDQIQQKQSKQ